MEKKVPFVIYDAAAGSGKTFTLVKEYLKIILQAKNEGYYKYILAITFTNKAVAEMKQRIINSLFVFSQEGIRNNPPEMAIQIAEETDLSLKKIQTQSKKVLKHLLHNYSSFSVETIDSFNHRLIRTFARDLKLSGNFEVSLDIPKLINEAVDQLISKAGENPKTTKALIDYALEKTDDDKSWDISKDIAKASGLLFIENDFVHIEKLKKKSFDEFLIFKEQLFIKRKGLTKRIKEIAENTLQLIEEAGLEFTDFSSGYLPKHFQKLASGKFDLNFKAKWQEALGEKPLYPGRVLKEAPELAAVLDELEPSFIENFNDSKKLAYQELLVKSMLKSVTPLSVINLVNQEIEAIKEEQNILPISEFNHLIYNEIKNQPTPFIYERLGERYRHFFIDEFQDTSLLQWQNMIPLIENALSYRDETQGSLLLVGDAKQSIYRWRGGLPEQFIGLCDASNPFQTEKELLHLTVNYRSCKEIIEFNNEFFSFISKHFGDSNHEKLYISGNQQKSTNKKGGYVKFEFIDSKNKEETHKMYAEKAHESITSLLGNGFEEKDICILTRRKADGILLGTYLQEQGITIVSSETLLLQHSLTVQFLIDCLTINLFPNNEEVKINFLEFLHQHLSVTEEKHTYFLNLLNEDVFSNYLKDKLNFSFNKMQSLSLYDSFEYCIRIFKLDGIADAYLFGFMDLVFDFEQQPKAGKISFLEDWELQKEKASIPVSEGVNGIQLMTIHRAKGLEFPVVLFPYADIDIYYEKEPKSWFPVKDKDFDFDETLIYSNINSIKEFGDEGKEIYKLQKHTLELDNLNLLYVTLTRAEAQLYIYTKKPNEIKDNKIKTYNQFFSEFLKHKGLWEEEKDIYEFGTLLSTSTKINESETKIILPDYISTPPEEHNLNVVTADAFLWDTEKEEAISSGTLLHEIMEKIKHEEDLVLVFEELENESEIYLEEMQSLRNAITSIVTHPKLNHFYKSSEEILNEKKIITSDGKILIPDRLNFHNDNSVTIIDYKTGASNKKHEIQINSYERALIEMGYRVSEKILIYSSSEGIVVNKV